MSKYHIDPRRIDGVVRETLHALDGNQFNAAEVCIGLAELLGRTIVLAGSTRIQMDELRDVAVSHMNRTIGIGAQASGKDSSIVSAFGG